MRRHGLPLVLFVDLEILTKCGIQRQLVTSLILQVAGMVSSLDELRIVLLAEIK